MISYRLYIHNSLAPHAQHPKKFLEKFAPVRARVHARYA